jgi:hypothetical protein
MLSLLGIIFFALMPMYSMQYGILLPNEKQDEKLQLQLFSTKSESTLINKILKHIKEKVRLNHFIHILFE